MTFLDGALVEHVTALSRTGADAGTLLSAVLLVSRLLNLGVRLLTSWWVWLIVVLVCRLGVVRLQSTLMGLRTVPTENSVGFRLATNGLMTLGRLSVNIVVFVVFRLVLVILFRLTLASRNLCRPALRLNADRFVLTWVSVVRVDVLLLNMSCLITCCLGRWNLLTCRRHRLCNVVLLSAMSLLSTLGAS